MIYKVELCCNDHNGDLHQLTAVDIVCLRQTWLSFRSRAFWMDNADGALPVSLEPVINEEGQVAGARLVIDGQPYSYSGCKLWAGNRGWNAYQMLAEEAVRLINQIHSLETGGWSLDEAHEELAALLESGQELSVELLEQIIRDEVGL